MDSYILSMYSCMYSCRTLSVESRHSMQGTKWGLGVMLSGAPRVSLDSKVSHWSMELFTLPALPFAQLPSCARKVQPHN